MFAAVVADRADWDAATCRQRHLAVAADAEIRRRHPGQRFTPLRSAFPAWPGPGKDAILQLLRPEIPPSPQILDRVMDRDLDMEAAD